KHSPSGGTPVSNTAPSAPTNLAASVISPSQINLSWTASTDNSGVAGYRVERCQGSGCTNFVQIGTPGVSSYSDNGLLANTAYGYRVRAVNAAGTLSSYSAIISATTANQSTAPAPAPAPAGVLTFKDKCAQRGVLG